MNWLRRVAGFHLTPSAFKASSALSLAVLVGPVCAGEWKGSVGGRAWLTLTDNVSLAPRGLEESDLYLGLSLPLSVRREGARVKLLADYTPSIFLYANSSESDNIQNHLRSLLSVEAVENFFFVDAFANISQTFISPFQPRPVNGGSITDNRTETITMGLSPYVTGVTRGGFSYLVRNDNTWTTYSESQLGSSLVSSVVANVESPGTRLRYGVDYNYIYTKYENQPSAYYEQLARLRPILTLNPTLTVHGRVGYETNDYPFADSDGVIYGGGFGWTPTPRTNLTGFAEERFFGLSYGLNFSHRTRLTGWGLTASRNSYTTTGAALALQPGTTEQVIDAGLLTRIPDPIQRQQAVGQLLASAGLPAELTSPYTFYTNQVYLSEQVAASVALLGKRNTATLRLFYQDTRPISASGNVLPDVLNTFNAVRQRGASLALTHSLSALSTLTFTAQRVYALATDPRISASEAEIESIHDTLHLIVTRQFSARTYGSTGARWQENDSDVSPYREMAVFASVSHTF